MVRTIASTVAALGLLLACGCASTMEDVNQGARDVGRPVGGVARIPGSVMEGAAEGVAGQPTPNPYNR
jgi:predicted Rossmann-fold nucleotide-binding protein